MRPFVLITDHPPLTAAVAPVIAAVGAELRVVATWAEGMAIKHQGALAYLTPFPLSEAELAQHPTSLLIFLRRPPKRERIGGPLFGPGPPPPRHVEWLALPFDPQELWLRIVRRCVPDQWERPFPTFPPMDQLWAGILDES